MNAQDDKELFKWAKEIEKRDEFIISSQDRLAASVEFQTLVNAYDLMPQGMKLSALKQIADFAVLFVIMSEMKL